MKELNYSVEKNNGNSKVTIENVNKLHDKVVAINEIINIINDIAAQANLLSLTMANTESTEAVSVQNLEIVRTMKTLSDELQILAGRINDIKETVN